MQRPGEVVGAALVADVPTMVLPEDERLELNEGKEISLVPGLHRMKAEQLDRLAPDTIIVFDAHWFTTVEFVVAGHERRSGRYTSDELPRGMCQVPYDFPWRPRAGEADRRGGDRGGVVDDADRRPVPADPLPDGQPAAVPAGRRAVGERQHGADCRDRRLPARRRGDRAGDRRSGRRVVLLASGAMGHTFWKLRELRAHEASDPSHIRTPKAREADLERLAWFRRETTPGSSTRCATSSRRQAGGDVRALPDDGRRHRRPRVGGAGRAVQRLRELRRHRPGPRLVLQTGARLEPSECRRCGRRSVNTPMASNTRMDQEVVLSAIWRVRSCRSGGRGRWRRR